MNRATSLAERLGIAPLTARSVALSALLGMHPPRLPAKALVAMGALFGIAEGTLRTALSRMALAGEVELDDGEYRLGERLRRRQAWQDATRRPDTEPWDGAWWCALVSAERRSTAQRRAFRALMTEHRMAELRPEVWLRPANIEGPPASDGVLVLRGPLAQRDPDLPGQLWNLPALATQARELTGLVDDALGWLAADGPAAMADSFLVSIATVRFLWAEPQLPPALVGDDWPPDTLRHCYDELESIYAHRMRSFLATVTTLVRDEQ